MSLRIFAVLESMITAPTYHLILEGILLIWVLWLIFRKSYKPEAKALTEKDELIEEWKPEPLVPPVPENHYALKPRIINSKLEKYIIVDDKNCLNLGTHNYLGLAGDKSLEASAIKALHKYGVGSCGPRGFYGTVDIHLELESRLAKFMNVEEAALYSYGFSAVASAIPAYSKSGDIIFCDEGVHLAIQKGLLASRSIVKYFKHNDVEDLKRLLVEQSLEDVKNPKKARNTRRFLVVEGLYMNHGDICPLPEIIKLKNQYKVRIFVDETCSFGVLGNTGRGVSEHFNIPTEEIDHFSATLENAISAYGGFCCGTSFVIDHHRLSGLGYCFSASLPPLQAAVAIAALDILEASNHLVAGLRHNCVEIHDLLNKIDVIEVEADDISPVKHLRFAKRGNNREKETQRLEAVCEYVIIAWKNSIALTLARYIESEERHCPEPSIRLIVNSLLTSEEIRNISAFLREAFEKCF
ncbi:serine palmitoyltransferase 1-like protein [Leptotrombidium deliense]|uniref:Serine palmitoyltransferase 1 n=1 Tax=Leptotrombidium deliense TaxID=299467 RepID=A0A443SK87_9ACAR|nr:serine palmitoyltransferase 1-like protein [Leptotrombidium deliense]